MRIAFTHNLKVLDNEEEAEFDTPETIAAISQALERLGHEVLPVEVSGPASRLVAKLEALAPDLVFNTAEGSHGRYREAFYPALFEQLRLPFTGSGAYACAVTLDKQATKLAVAQHGVPTPRWIFVRELADLDDHGLDYPVIAKPNYEGSSKGVTTDSVVTNDDALRALTTSLLERYPDGVLVEEFIVGHDVTVPYLQAKGVLAPAMYAFDASVVGSRQWDIYDYLLKNEASHAVEVIVPAPLADEVITALTDYTIRVMQALDIDDMGRADFRVTDDGRIYFIEVNALPSLEPGASIYESAQLAGLDSVDAVLATIVGSAQRRQGISERAPRAVDALRVGLTYNLKRVDPRANDAEAEYDSMSTIEAIRDAIASFGHEVVLLEATPDLMGRLPHAEVDLVFNIAEGIGSRNREAQVPAMLDLLGIEYTGSDATTMCITLDKALAKRIVSQAGVKTAPFLLVRPGEPVGEMAFPAIVKPNAEGSSKGVPMGKAVVHDRDELESTVAMLHDRYRQPVLVESFLPGREFTVGLMGNDPPRALAPMEIVFDVAHDHPVYTFEHKLDPTGEVRYEVPANVTPELGEALVATALTAYEALGCRDVSRIDLRLDAAGDVNFIECNPLPGLTPGWSDLCLAAQGSGLDYAGLILEVMAPAIRRLRAREES